MEQIVFNQMGLGADVKAFITGIFLDESISPSSGNFIDTLTASSFSDALGEASRGFANLADEAKADPSSTPSPSPSPSPGGSIAAALDTNGNGVLDGSEVRMGIQYWIMGETVPGTSETISDAKMRELITLWILGAPVGQNAKAQSSMTSTNLSVQGLRLIEPTDIQRRIQLNAHNVVTASGFSGGRWDSGVRKMVVLR